MRAGATGTDSKGKDLAVGSAEGREGSGKRNTGGDDGEDLEAFARKWGFEAALARLFSRGKSGGGGLSRTEQAKRLFKTYGSAYLVTSIGLSLVSYALCYLLISAGVDVAGVLNAVGIKVTETSQSVGVASLAYIAHKAASPIRFPPTLALTPFVANMMGKQVDSEASAGAEGGDSDDA